MAETQLAELLSLKQASELLSCHPNTLRMWEQKGLIRAVRFGVRKDRRFKKSEVLRLIAKSASEQTLEHITLPSTFDLSRIDMTSTWYENIDERSMQKHHEYNNLQREEIEKFNFKKFIAAFNERIVYFEERDFLGCKTTAEKILHIITSPKYRSGTFETLNLAKYKEQFLKKFNAKISNHEPVQFMFPAFPFKIANSLKSSRRDADLAEVGSLCKLNEINLQIQKVYAPGAEFIVFHDGHLYYRHFLHTKEDADVYYTSLQRFVMELHLQKIIILKDVFTELEKIPEFPSIYAAARVEMTNLWNNKKSNEKMMRIIQSSKQNINVSDIPYDILYHINFLEDWDLSATEKETKKIIETRADACAFEYMVVQHALEKCEFLANQVPDGVRLTVHPKEGQIGIYLVKRKTHLLPWMGVGVLKNNGEVSVHYESELLSTEKYYPVFLGGEDFAFYFKEAESVYEGLDEFKKLFTSIEQSLRPKNYYWAFSFNTEYADQNVTDLLTEFHKKLKEKSIEDRAICRTETLPILDRTYADNTHIRIKSTEREIPHGVIILKDRVVNLLWGDKPAAFEVHTPEIVARYKKYFQMIWEETKK